MHTSMHKRAPMWWKLKVLAGRMRQLFKVGKAQQAYNQKYSENNNNNCESENNNNINSELCNLAEQLTNEMAQNAANEWILQQAATLLHTADAYAGDTESNIICLHTEAGHFYWSATVTQAMELYSCREIDFEWSNEDEFEAPKPTSNNRHATKTHTKSCKCNHMLPMLTNNWILF